MWVVIKGLVMSTQAISFCRSYAVGIATSNTIHASEVFQMHLRVIQVPISDSHRIINWKCELIFVLTYQELRTRQRMQDHHRITEISCTCLGDLVHQAVPKWFSSWITIVFRNGTHSDSDPQD